MQLELEFTNESTAIPVIGAMLDQALGQLAVDSDTATALGELALDVVRDSVESAYPQGEEGTIKLTFRQRHSKFEILVRDFGLPRDVEKLERRFPFLFGSS
jgi:anti-sigma regulatory factor (Ser/Thr protein kinase)